MDSGLFYVSGFHFVVSFINVTTEDEGESESTKFPILPDISFSEVSGLGAEVETDEISEGGNNSFRYKLPKRTKYKNLVLKRALSTIPSILTTWINISLQNFEFHPCTVVVAILNEHSIPIKIWNFSNVYPIKVEYSSLNANKAELVIETLELAYNESKKIL